MASGFVHVELSTGDVKSAKDFYKKMFKWKLEDMKMGEGMTYTMFKPEEHGPGGGMMDKNAMGKGDAPSMWLPYVLVDSVDKSVAQAKKLGAMIMVEKQEVPNMGWFSIIGDPTGAAIGIWQAAKMEKPAARKVAAPKKKAKAAKKAAPKKAKKKA